MNRLEATRLLVSLLRDELVVASLGHPAYDLFVAGDRPENFYTWGSMGLASSIGVGLALARPDRQVVVLDGDGSLLMNLGSLATMAWTGPRNLTLIVWDNQEYGTTGGQPTATSHGADLARIAQAAGIPFAATVSTAEDFTTLYTSGEFATGPRIIVAKVTESGTAAKPPLDCVFIKQRFMTAAGCPEDATLGGV